MRIVLTINSRSAFFSSNLTSRYSNESKRNEVNKNCPLQINKFIEMVTDFLFYAAQVCARVCVVVVGGVAVQFVVIKYADDRCQLIKVRNMFEYA